MSFRGSASFAVAVPVFASIAAVLAVAACSSGGGGALPSSSSSSGGGGGGGASVSSLCSALCGWRDRCGKSEGGCAEECNREAGPLVAKWRASYVNHVSSCFQTLACDASDDRCISNFAAADPQHPNVPVVQRCLSKRAECDNAFSDDYCLSLSALTDSARSEADACLGGTCEGIRDCLRTAGAFNY